MVGQKPLSRQRLWQLRKQARGKCITCGRRRATETRRCATCRKKFNAMKRRIWHEHRQQLEAS